MLTTPEFLKDVFFLVEANSFEIHKLWEENEKYWKFSWEQEVGLSETIGELDDMPVCICMMPARIARKRVIFWDLVSMVKDYRMVDPFFEKNECNPMWDNGTRRSRADASNFHQCAHAIKENLNYDN